jgi:putative ABC transport system permease protein
MNPWVTFKVALRALLRNKTRSGLTMLGIVIGVSAVIAMVAIGEGAKVKVAQAFDAMGTNLLIVMSGSSHGGGMRGGAGSMPTLTWGDLASIRTEVPSVKYAAPVCQTNASIQSDDQNWTTTIVGTSLEYFAIRNWPIDRGTLFSVADNDSGAKVLVMGTTVAEKLYGVGVDPVGRTVRVRGSPFQIVGLLASKGQSPMGQDYDDAVVMPVTTFRAKIQGGLAQYIPGVVFVGATSSKTTSRAQRDMEDLLRDRHHLQEGIENDFSIRNLSELAGASQQGTQVMTTLLAAVAAVSLLVGGIGIMNILLVSVTERTREIGVRMAMGAKPRDILAQFLVEALTLAVMGGLIGIGLGILVAERLAASFQWPLLIRGDIIVLAVGFSAAIGIVFGLYPAWKASRLDPIDALRYE